MEPASWDAKMLPAFAALSEFHVLWVRPTTHKMRALAADPWDSFKGVGAAESFCFLALKTRGNKIRSCPADPKGLLRGVAGVVCRDRPIRRYPRRDHTRTQCPGSVHRSRPRSPSLSAPWTMPRRMATLAGDENGQGRLRVDRHRGSRRVRRQGRGRGDARGLLHARPRRPAQRQPVELHEHVRRCIWHVAAVSGEHRSRGSCGGTDTTTDTTNPTEPAHYSSTSSPPCFTCTSNGLGVVWNCTSQVWEAGDVFSCGQ
jgi:hypothetical protein